MKKKIYRLSAINANGEQFLVATEVSYDERGVGTRRMAAVPVDPSKAQSLLKGCRENTLHIEYGAGNRQNPGVFVGTLNDGADPELAIAAPATTVGAGELKTV